MTETKLIADRRTVGIERIHGVDKIQCCSRRMRPQITGEKAEAIRMRNRPDDLVAKLRHLPRKTYAAGMAARV